MIGLLNKWIQVDEIIGNIIRWSNDDDGLQTIKKTLKVMKQIHDEMVGFGPDVLLILNVAYKIDDEYFKELTDELDEIIDELQQSINELSDPPRHHEIRNLVKFFDNSTMFSFYNWADIIIVDGRNKVRLYFTS